MSSLFDLLTVPAAALGLALGLLCAIAFHWLAPAGIDTVSAGAWFTALGWLGGLVWALISGKRED